jgi:hypothetical protein
VVITALPRGPWGGYYGPAWNPSPGGGPGARVMVAPLSGAARGRRCGGVLLAPVDLRLESSGGERQASAAVRQTTERNYNAN